MVGFDVTSGRGEGPFTSPPLAVYVVVVADAVVALSLLFFSRES